MNTYYVVGVPFSDELYHHGIKGQKWGVRRFQNPDGTLTSEGKRRYGDRLGSGANKHGIIRRLVTGDWALGAKRFGERIEKHYAKKAEKNRKLGNTQKAEKSELKRRIMQERNVARDVYASNADTGKMFLQNYLLGGLGAMQYRTARGLGSGRGRAAAEGFLMNMGIGGIVVSNVSSFSNTKDHMNSRLVNKR